MKFFLKTVSSRLCTKLTGTTYLRTCKMLSGIILLSELLAFIFGTLYTLVNIPHFGTEQSSGGFATFSGI
jgi:hypothetical protein